MLEDSQAKVVVTNSRNLTLTSEMTRNGRRSLGVVRLPEGSTPSLLRQDHP